MATALERQQQHDAALRLERELQEKVAMFRRRVDPPRPLTAALRKRPVSPPTPARPPVSRFADRLLAEIPSWQLAVRAVARKQAAEQADAEHQRLLEKHEERKAQIAEDIARAEAEQEAEQRLLQVAHQRLLGGDPGAADVSVERALQHYPVPAAAFGVSRELVSLAVIVPPVGELVPEREASYTPAGKPTTRKRPQGDRNDLYVEAVCGLALGAARAALTAAPAIPRASVLVFSTEGRARVPIGYCSVAREQLNRWSGSNADAVIQFYECDGLLEQAGRVRAVQPLDVSDQPQLAAVLEQLRRKGWQLAA